MNVRVRATSEMRDLAGERFARRAVRFRRDLPICVSPGRVLTATYGISS